MGDRILKVNGTDVTTATHQEAVMELLRPCDEIKLTVQHDPLPAGFQVRHLSFKCKFVCDFVHVRKNKSHSLDFYPSTVCASPSTYIC